MEFLKTIGKAVGEAAAHLGEKNHRAAQLSRIRSFIRCQEKAAEKEYLALGRYYYHNLRDKENDVTEAHCLAPVSYTHLLRLDFYFSIFQRRFSLYLLERFRKLAGVRIAKLIVQNRCL